MRNIETFRDLEAFLNDTALFSETEVSRIMTAVGKATAGNAIIACELVGIELTGNDIDEMLKALNY
jgi:hypothetical protein